MPARERVTRTLKASDARAHWSELLNQVFRGESRILVEKSGIPVAAIVSADDLQALARMEAQREEHFKALRATRDAFADIPDEELEQEVARAVAEARQRRREQQRTPGSP